MDKLRARPLVKQKEWMVLQGYKEPDKEKKHGREFEFQFLCRGDEACKRIRFRQETGIFVKPSIRMPAIVTNVLGTPSYSSLIKSPYKDIKKPNSFVTCGHEVPLPIVYDAMSDKVHSLEIQCFSCGTTLTLVNGDMEFKVSMPGSKEMVSKNFEVLAIVDFEHYDDYPKDKGRLKLIIEDKGELSKRV